MKNFKQKAIAAAFILAALPFLAGCQDKVITVADVWTEDEKEPAYIEMQEFELKEKQENSGREDIKYCAVMIPAGYQESEETPGMYLHERAPLDSSNIYYTVSEGSGNGLVSDDLTKEDYREIMTEALKKGGRTGSLFVESFEEIDMEGIPAYKIRSSYEETDNVIEQLTYLIMAEDTYTITYSQAGDDELMADFEVSDGEIRLVKEESVELAKK